MQLQIWNKLKNNILPPTYLFISIIVMALLNFMLPIGKFIPVPWNLMGIILLILGISINVLADIAFRSTGTTIKPFEESTFLVTNGLYRFTRNPMYLGFVIMLIGSTLFLQTVTPFLIISLFIFLIHRRFILVEEQMLETKFGQYWLEYKTNTRRWI